VSRASQPAIAWPTARALLREVLLCGAALVAGASWWSWWSGALAFCFIATRQHALFILYHDAVHGLVARQRRMNDLIINLAAGVPMLIPVHIYRRFHISHHATLGTPSDTERLLLYRWQPWNYQPLGPFALARQLLGDLLLLNQVRMAWALLSELRDPASLLRLPPMGSLLKTSPETIALQLVMAAGISLAFWQVPEVSARVAILWFGPLLTLTQLIQKVRSFAEHGPMDGDKPSDLTYSWRPGWLARQVLWPYHIGYHREHHEAPNIPWFALPTHFADRPGRPAAALLPLLLRRRGAGARRVG